MNKLYYLLLPVLIFMSSCSVIAGNNSATATSKLTYQDLEPSAYKYVVQTGQIKKKKLKEISGIAASHYHPNHFWAITDSGNASELYLLNDRGEKQGRVAIAAENIDWEDLVSFRWQDKFYVAIADIGDNRSKRNSVRLLIMEEPQNKSSDEAIRPNILEFTYEDGPRDCESLAFNIHSGEFILLTKREVPPKIYRLPFSLGADKQTAKAVIGVNNIPQPSLEDLNARYGILSPQPTAMDMHPKGDGFMVQTYKNAYWYAWQNNLEKTFSQKPELVDVPRLRQTEAMAFSDEGNAIYVVSEGNNSPVMKIATSQEQAKP